MVLVKLVQDILNQTSDLTHKWGYADRKQVYIFSYKIWRQIETGLWKQKTSHIGRNEMHK